MKMKFTCFIFIIFMVIASCTSLSYFEVKKPVQHTLAVSTNYTTTMKQDILCLMAAYKEHIKGIECMDDGRVYIIMKSGKRILYDDKKKKSFEQKLSNPDLQDMLEQIYPLHDIRSLADLSFDPGRIRVYPLLNEVYGASKGQIEKNLVNVSVGGFGFQFNRRNNAAEELKSVMKELIPLTVKGNSARVCVFPMSGTFNYRYISGTNRLSPHSFGIAIDLARDKRDYWKWASREEGQKRLSSYSMETVRIFEKNNFIWGGKWGHFDILHFEYRPEIILKSRYFGESRENQGLWYNGVPFEDDYIKRCIENINTEIIEDNFRETVNIPDSDIDSVQ